VQRGNIDFCTECRLGKIDREFVNDIIVFTNKQVMFLYVEVDIQITRIPASYA